MTSAVIVILELGEPRVFSSPLLCQLLPNTLFWGPEETVKFAESSTRTDEWIHPHLAFAGALIDLDEKRLTWFIHLFGMTQADGGVRPHARVLYERLLESRWPGYTIEYAHNGLSQLASIAGKDPTTLPAITRRL